MHTGAELGGALKVAIQKKGVTQKDVATAFGITQPSVSEWIKFGRIGKQHIPLLVGYFADVVGPEHWGLPRTWNAASGQQRTGDYSDDDLAGHVAQLLQDISTAPPELRMHAVINAGLAVWDVRNGTGVVAAALESAKPVSQPRKARPQDARRRST